MYEWEKSPLSHELFKIGLLKIFSPKFVSSICNLQIVAPQKSWSSFSFFGYPNHEWTPL